MTVVWGRHRGNLSVPSRSLGIMSNSTDLNLPVVRTPAEIFADPVGYLASLGVDATTVGDIGLPVAA